ncbi:MAG: hypothetical protein ACREJ2_13900 [Planctomycetota bacterium]
MIRWKCPQCQSVLGAPEWSIGRRVPCPVCTNGIKVPAASDNDPIGTPETPQQERREESKRATGCCSCIVVAVVAVVIIFVVGKIAGIF